MTDEQDTKVVNLFSAHKKSKSAKCTPTGKKNKSLCQSPDGHYYVAVDTDENGRFFDEKDLLACANAFYYIVKVMVKNKLKEGQKVRIHNYKISAEELMDFIKIYTEGKGDGQIIEIDKFFQDDWA